MAYYRNSTYAVNTRKAYRTHRNAYLRFCTILSTDPVPASTPHLCMYAAYLARFLVPSSVCIYLNFVGILHKEYGLNNTLLDNWTLSTVLRGIKREKGVPPVPKLPITHDILSFIHSQLNFRDSKQASFWAICLVSFFGLFLKEFSPGTYLTRSDFTFRDPSHSGQMEQNYPIRTTHCYSPFGSLAVICPLPCYRCVSCLFPHVWLTSI